MYRSVDKFAEQLEQFSCVRSGSSTHVGSQLPAPSVVASSRNIEQEMPFSRMVSQVYIQNFSPYSRRYLGQILHVRAPQMSHCISDLAFSTATRNFPGMLSPSCVAHGACSLVHRIADYALLFAW